MSQQLKSPIGSVREYDIDELLDILGIGVSTEVKGTVKFVRTHRGILVQGTLKGKIPAECSRCLKVFDFPITINLEEEFFPIIDVNSGVPLEIPDEPGGFTIDEHHLLDLSEAIRQNALLAVPMKPLCRKDCAGLCQQCGKDLNQGQCDCDKDEIDPRWAKLIGTVLFSKKDPPQDNVVVANATGNAELDKTLIGALRGGGWNVPTFVDQPAKSTSTTVGASASARALSHIFATTLRPGSTTTLVIGSDLAPASD